MSELFNSQAIWVIALTPLSHTMFDFRLGMTDEAQGLDRGPKVAFFLGNV
ncbi:MAG: hypothetical protein KY448_01095 [Cyanobacteria bacterium 0813]|nr:hypothetical protein [Cyanobacteria bacterium 0813]